MDAVRCQLEIPQVQNLEAGQLTVGRHAILNCKGDFNKSFDFSKAQVKLEENQKYTIKVLKAEARDADSFDVDLTLYQAVQFQFKEMILSDGANEINLGAQQFLVKSVIEKTEDGKPPKAFGSLLPLPISWPAVYFISLVVLVVLLLSGLIWQLKRAARFARLIAGLKQYDSNIDPDLQFYKSIRALEKQEYPILDVEKAFKLYLLRIFKVPTFDLNNAQVIRFFKSRVPVLKTTRNQIKKMLEEFEEIKLKNIQLDKNEKAELIKKLYRFVDTQNKGLRK